MAACEETDCQLQRVLGAGQKVGYSFLVIADHGNAELARNADGSPHTAHTTNLVPVVAVADGVTAVRDGILADVAPTLLHLMGVDVPEEMTGTRLV